jgi:hypothetical protein
MRLSFEEVQARRAALLPRLERLLTSLDHWQGHNKMRVLYSLQSGPPAPPRSVNGNGHLRSNGPAVG